MYVIGQCVCVYVCICVCVPCSLRNNQESSHFSYSCRNSISKFFNDHCFNNNQVRKKNKYKSSQYSKQIILKWNVACDKTGERKEIGPGDGK